MFFNIFALQVLGVETVVGKKNLKAAVSPWIPSTGKDNFAIPHHSCPELARVFNLKFSYWII